MRLIFKPCDLFWRKFSLLLSFSTNPPLPPYPCPHLHHFRFQIPSWINNFRSLPGSIPVLCFLVYKPSCFTNQQILNIQTVGKCADFKAEMGYGLSCKVSNIEIMLQGPPIANGVSHQQSGQKEDMSELNGQDEEIGEDFLYLISPIGVFIFCGLYWNV